MTLRWTRTSVRTPTLDVAVLAALEGHALLWETSAIAQKQSPQGQLTMCGLVVAPGDDADSGESTALEDQRIWGRNVSGVGPSEENSGFRIHTAPTAPYPMSNTSLSCEAIAVQRRDTPFRFGTCGSSGPSARPLAVPHRSLPVTLPSTVHARRSRKIAIHNRAQSLIRGGCTSTTSVL